MNRDRNTGSLFRWAESVDKRSMNLGEMNTESSLKENSIFELSIKIH